MFVQQQSKVSNTQHVTCTPCQLTTCLTAPSLEQTRITGSALCYTRFSAHRVNVASTNMNCVKHDQHRALGPSLPHVRGWSCIGEGDYGCWPHVDKATVDAVKLCDNLPTS